MLLNFITLYNIIIYANFSNTMLQKISSIARIGGYLLFEATVRDVSFLKDENSPDL
jgi:hypothetical protein